MVVKSFHAPLQIPNIDLWQHVFERKDRPFPEDKSMYESFLHFIHLVSLYMNKKASKQSQSWVLTTDR